jgi:hypothetical protein
VAEVKRDQRTRGRYLGGKPPSGWRAGDVGELNVVPEQHKAIEEMRALRAKGTPLRAIADKITRDGVRISFAGVNKVLDATAAPDKATQRRARSRGTDQGAWRKNKVAHDNNVVKTTKKRCPDWSGSRPAFTKLSQ